MGNYSPHASAPRLKPTADDCHLKSLTDENWKLPFALTVAVHLATLILAVVSPYLHIRQPLPEIQTVNLFNASELPAPAPAPAAKPKAVQSQPPAATPKPSPPKPEPVEIQPPPPPPPTRPVVSTAAESKVITPKEPGKEVSLRPVKAKKSVAEERKESKADETRLERAMHRLETKASQIKAAERAEKEVANAMERIRQSIHTSRPTTPAPVKSSAGIGSSTATATGTGTSSSTGISGDQTALVKQQYYASVIMHLSRFWSLPETDWSDDLVAIAIIWLEPTGKLIKTAFERQSDNDLFNRFVSQTIDKANPFPPVPDELQKEFKEKGIGIRFRPADFR